MTNTFYTKKVLKTRVIVKNNFYTIPSENGKYNDSKFCTQSKVVNMYHWV